MKTRRVFMTTLGRMGVALAALGGSVPGLGRWFAPADALAADASVLSTAQAKQMLAMTRQLFPHERLGDAPYQTVVDAIAKEMAGSADLTKQIHDGLDSLNQAAGGDFTAASDERQIAAMKELENTPFFGAMAGKTRYYLYNNPAVWADFGFEGSSWEKGGYINRGFNDVNWTDG